MSTNQGLTTGSRNEVGKATAEGGKGIGASVGLSSGEESGFKYK